MENRKDTFYYTYSAKQQEEIRNIRKRYLPQEPEENKMEQLRRLDQSATKKGTVVSLIVGIIGCLLLGVGMCCILPSDKADEAIRVLKSADQDAYVLGEVVKSDEGVILW